MSYQNYVIAAYVVFVAAMAWDWLSPKLQIRQQLRIARLRAKRASVAPHAPHGRHPHGEDAVS